MLSWIVPVSPAVPNFTVATAEFTSTDVPVNVTVFPLATANVLVPSK